MKSVCCSLSLDRLDARASEMTEHLRVGNLASALEMLPRFTADYRLAIDTIRRL